MKTLHALRNFRYWTFFHLYSAVLGLIVTSLNSGQRSTMVFLGYWMWSQIVAAVVEMGGGCLADRFSVKKVVLFGQSLLGLSTLSLGLAVFAYHWQQELPLAVGSLIIANQCLFGAGMACFAGKDKVLTHEAGEQLEKTRTQSKQEDLDAVSEKGKSQGNLVAAVLGSALYFLAIYLGVGRPESEMKQMQAGAALLVLGLTFLAQMYGLRLTSRIRYKKVPRSRAESKAPWWANLRGTGLFRTLFVSGILEAVFLLMSAVSMLGVFKHISRQIVETTDQWRLAWLIAAPLVSGIVFVCQLRGLHMARVKKQHAGTAEGWTMGLLALCIAGVMFKLVFVLTNSVGEQLPKPPTEPQAGIEMMRAASSQPLVTGNLPPHETIQESQPSDTQGATASPTAELHRATRTVQDEKRHVVLLLALLFVFCVTEYGRTNIRTTLQLVTYDMINQNAELAPSKTTIMSIPGFLAKSMSFLTVSCALECNSLVEKLMKIFRVPDSVFAEPIFICLMTLGVLGIYMLVVHRLHPGEYALCPHNSSPA
jgi:MFS family permease